MPGREKWVEQEEMVAAWLGEGHSYATVSDATGVPKGSLWSIARRARARQAGTGATTRRIWTIEQCQRMLGLRAQGLSYPDISQRTGVPHGSIGRCLALARAEQTRSLDPAVTLPEATRPAQPPEPRRGEPDVPSPEQYVLAFVEYVEGERRTLREANRELAEAVTALREQLDAAQGRAADAAVAMNAKVFSDHLWREKLSLLGKVTT
jgi:uncharacterized protein YerC